MLTIVSHATSNQTNSSQKSIQKNQSPIIPHNKHHNTLSNQINRQQSKFEQKRYKKYAKMKEKRTKIFENKFVGLKFVSFNIDLTQCVQPDDTHTHSI